MPSLQDITRRVQSSLKSVSESLASLGRRTTRKAMDALSSGINFINNNIFSLYNSFTNNKSKRIRTDINPSIKSSVKKQSIKPLTQNLKLRADTIDLMSKANIRSEYTLLSDNKVFTAVHEFDTSDDANIFFPMGDENTTEAILILKKRSDEKLPQQIMSHKEGYDIVLTTTFENMDTEYRKSLSFENNFIDYGHIQKRLEESVLEYTMVLTEVRVMYSVRPEQKGGCSLDTKLTTIKFHDVTLKLKSAKSKNHNCGIDDVREWKGLKGNIIRANTIRKKLGFEPNTKLSPEDLHKVCEYFECSCVIYNGNDDYKVISEYKHPKYHDEQNIIHLVLMNEHYMYVRERFFENQCKDCGRRYLKTHTCNEERVTFYQAKVNKQLVNYVVNRKKYIKRKNPQLTKNDVCPFDYETFPDDKTKCHIPYAVSWRENDTFKTSYGKSASDKFIDAILKMENKILVSFNGSRYDNYLLLEKLKSRNMKDENLDVIISNGRILMISFGEKTGHRNKIIDLAQFIPNSSLKKACEDFNTKHRKYDVDHHNIRSWDDVEAFRDKIEPYVVNDVKCLDDLFFTLNDMIYDQEGLNLSCAVTLAQLGYTLWTNTLPQKTIEFVQDKETYKFIRKGIYGGRCYPLIRESTSKLYDQVKNGEITHEQLEKTNDFVYPADATSLYPASMYGCKVCPVEYPVGHFRWTENPQQDYDDGKLGYYKVKWQCPNKKLRVAVLPTKSDDGLKQSLEGGEGVYTNIDIQNAQSVGYTFEFIDKAVVWDQSSSTIFTEFIGKWFKIKQENSGTNKNKNKSLRKLSKLLMNSLYGKMLQDVNDDGMRFCYNIEQIWRFKREYKITDFHVFDSDQGKYLLLQGKVRENELENKNKKPVQLGGFVLAYSRKIMLQYMKEVDPTLESPIFSYMDTDSLHINGEAYHKLKDKGYIMDAETSELGMLCGDYDDEGLIIRETNLASKNYYKEYINNKNEIIKKCVTKGIPKEDKLGTKDTLLKPELWDSCEPIEMNYKSFKRIRKPTLKEQDDGVNWFNIRTIDCTRTWHKNSYDRMIFKDNQYYPFGYEFG